MRRKITDKPKLEAEDLPDITSQQMKFVEGILAGKTASDAYRAGYDCSNMLPETVWAAASRLRNDSKVELWIAACRKAHLGPGSVSLEGHIRELERLKEIAIATGNVGAAVQAEQLRGKAQGHYVEKMELTHHNPDAILDEIREILPNIDAEKLLPN